MTKVKFNLKGVKELNSKLKDIDINTQRLVSSEIQKSTLRVESEAKRRSPVDTGRLRSSIRSLFTSTRLRGQVFTDVVYSKFIEFGTRFMRAQPFLFPAWEQERPRLIENVKRIFRRIR